MPAEEQEEEEETAKLRAVAAEVIRIDMSSEQLTNFCLGVGVAEKKELYADDHRIWFFSRLFPEVMAMSIPEQTALIPRHVT